MQVGDIRWDLLWRDLALLWQQTLPAIFAGCLMGSFLKYSTLSGRIAGWTRPLYRFARLPSVCGMFFVLSFVNRYSARAYLADLQRDGRLTERQTLAAYLAAALPTSLQFMIFYTAPALISALGFRLGAIYLGCYFAVQAIVSIGGLLWNRRHAPDASGPGPAREESPRSAGEGRLAGDVLRQFWFLSRSFVGATFLAFFLLRLPAARDGMEAIGPLLSGAGMPAASVLVLAAGIPSMVAAIGVSGAVLVDGALSPKQVLVVLSAAAVAHDVYELFAGVLPTNAAFFGARLGTKISLVSLALRIAGITACICGIAVFF